MTGYTVTSTPAGIVISTSTTRALFAGLLNGTSYTFTVTATNAIGVSAPSVASLPVTPATVPSAPPSVIAMAGNSRAVVSWTRPIDDGGSRISSFLVHDAAGALVASTTDQTQAVVSGLVNGTTHAFTVTAVNAVGPGVPSQFSNSVTPLAVPDAPTAVLARAGNGSAIVNWTAPLDTGGGAIILYTVTSEPGGFSATTTGATQVTVPGLLNGTAYEFTVRASNSLGMGLPSSPSNTVTPATHPGVPTSVTATGGNAEAIVRWEAPFDDGGGPITSYTVTATPGGRAVTNTGGLAATVSGLTNGVSYTFTVRATNWAGTGMPSSASLPVIPLSVPSAPSQAVATGGDGFATVSWSAPADVGGTPVLSYTVRSDPEGHTAVVSGATSTTVSGLTNGTSYTFTVTALNAVGEGGPSFASSPVTPSGVPFAPLGVSAVAGDQQATVSWAASNDNGAPVTEYRVVSTPGGVSATTTGATSVVVAGLGNGTPYSFTVTARNRTGVGLPSSASSPVVPAGLPQAPTNLAASPADGRITLSWTAPAANGSAITGYTLTGSPGGVVNATSTSVLITGLTNGTPYTFTVSASNAVGTGPASAPLTARPSLPPGAPTGVTAIGATGQATVSWTAPSSDGGNPVTGYLLSSVPAGLQVIVGPQTQVVLSGLVWSASYAFKVSALNAAGQGPASAPSNTVALFSPVCAGPLVFGAQLPQVNARSNLSAAGLVDLNGDGILDLLLADQTSGQLTVHRGRGGGTFGDGIDSTISPNNGSKSLATADFNDDGRPDVAIANTGASLVTVWLTDSSGALSTRIDSPSSMGISTLATGDFDRDGHVDLVVSDSTQFSLMRGTGTGVLISSVLPYPGRSVVSGDFDGDGILDVVSLNGTIGPRFARGVGDGTFLPATTVAAVPAAAQATFDANRDGRLDLAFALSTGLVAVVLSGDGGTFSNPVFYVTSINPVVSIHAMDLTGDGLQDLVTSTAGSSSVLVAVPGGFEAAPNQPFCVLQRLVALGDLTGDQRPDLVAICPFAGPSTLHLLPGRGDGTFPVSQATGSAGSTPISLTTGDFNGDGQRDVATANLGSASLTVMLGTGDGNVTTLASYPVGSEPMFVISVDVTGDGQLDLVVASRLANTVSVLRGQGNGTFQAATSYPAGAGASAVAAADFNADGLMDLAVAAVAANQLTIMLGNGSGGFTISAVSVPGGPHSVAVGDLDGDGKKDLVVALWTTNRVGAFLGNGDGTFVSQGTYPVANTPRSVALEDFDGDGRLDVAVAHNGATSLSTLRGNGDGTFQGQVSLPARSIQTSVIASDLDGDGAVDLITPNWDARSIGVYRGRGDGSFLPAITYGISSNSYMVIAEDMNGDGSKDLVLVNSSSTNISVLLRTGCLP